MIDVQTPAARATDDETSHLAADHITRTGQRAHQQHQASAAVTQFPGCTSFELAQRCAMDRFMLARRLPECITAGVVHKGAVKKCSMTGRQAVTWWPGKVSQPAASAA